MTRERAKELLPVMQAFAEGKEIEARAVDAIGWVNVSYPKWEDEYVWRVKPDIPDPKELWIVRWGNDRIFNSFVTDSLEAARRAGPNKDNVPYRILHVLVVGD